MINLKLFASFLFLWTTARPTLAQEGSDGSSNLSEEELGLLCLQHPTWHDSTGTISYDRCKEALKFDPRENDFLKNAPDDFSGGKESEWYKKMQSCMAEKAEARPKSSETPYNGPTVSQMFPDAVEPTLAVVDFAISDEAAAIFLDLSACVKKNHPRQFMRRSFQGEDEDFYAEGGNDVTFVGGFLPLFAPGVAAQMCMSYRAAWKKLRWYEIVEDAIPFMFDPCNLGWRTAEYLSYEPTGWSSLGGHTDIDTMYTMLLLLADPSEYDGGEFYMKPWAWGGEDAESEFKLIFKPDRLQALIFLADLEYHGVQEITRGKRRAIAVELWEYASSPIGVNRPQTYEYMEFIENGSWEGIMSAEEQISSDPKTGARYVYEG